MRAASVEFWDHYARWYKLWVEHTRYHQKIIEVLGKMISPGWRVLDVGAGTGVLSIPLSHWGCHVVALEPSSGMRNLLEEGILNKKTQLIRIEQRPWESVYPEEFLVFDLIIACNSLHLTPMEFEKAVEKLFQTEAKNIFLVYEMDSLCFPVSRFYKNYGLVFKKSYEVEDSFAYHNWREVLGHHRFLHGHVLQVKEMNELKKKIIFRGEHFWLKNTSKVSMCWWKKIC